MAIEIIPLIYYLQKDFDITVLYGEKESDEKEIFYLLEFYPGLVLKKIPFLHKSTNLINDMRAYHFIANEIKTNNYEVLHTHGSKAGFLGRMAGIRFKVPCIVHTFHGHLFHSYFNSFVSGFLVKLERWLAGFTTHIIATSEQQKKDLVSNYKIASPEKVTVVHLGVDIKIFFHNFTPGDRTFRSKYKLSDDTVAVGIIARIVPVKNFELFARVVHNIIHSVQQPVKFFVIGDGAMKKNVQQTLDAENISWCSSEQFTETASVIFTSWIENIVPVLHALDIVMLTSNNEGTALALVEAQLCGKPVVATNVGGVRDTFIDCETGFLAERGDETSFSEKLKMLIENKALRETMGAKAVTFATNKFSKETEVEKIKQLYTNCKQ